MFTRKIKILILVGILILISWIIDGTDVYAAEKKIKLTVPYSTLGGGMTPLWLAKDTGIFDKYGLDVELMYISSGSKVAQAMLAGEVQIAFTSGSATVQADLGGADQVIIACTINRSHFSMMVRPEIKKVEDLKGKAIGITRFGSSTDFVARHALKEWGYTVGKNVTLLQMGGVPEILAALRTGAIQAGILSDPTTAQAEKLGFYELPAYSNIKFEYTLHVITTTKSFIKSNEDTVMAFMKAFIEGIALFMNDKELAIKTISRYTKVDDRDILLKSYEEYSNKYIQKIPYSTKDGIQTVLDELVPTTPKAKTAKPEDFIDMRFVKYLDETGFIKNLYKK